MPASGPKIKPSTEAPSTYSVYLVRHAIAEERGADWPDDAKRPLTRKGLQRMRAAVEGFARLDPAVALVLTSPLVRARQTAELLIDGLSPKPALDALPALSPGEAPRRVAEALGKYVGRQAIALVGHEPSLGELAAWLIGAPSSPPFKKGGICRIDVPRLPPDRDGRLIWFATPRMLRALAGK
jgi:phosphohistidine phosphatase